MTKKSELLESVQRGIKVEINEGFDPVEYFKTRKGLYVFSDFPDRILSKAEPVKEAVYTLDSFKLTEYAEDKEIEKALPKKHIFSESEVCAVIAKLIEQQAGGEEGALLNNGWWNLFYTPAFVVSVRWRDDGSGWFVGSWHRDERGWYDDGRVFSPAN